jgi:hypothetical protein
VGKTAPEFGLHFKTIAIPIMVNNSPEPLLETLLTAAIREKFIRDGRLTVVATEQADLILRGKIINYGVRTLSFDDQDRSSEVRIRIDAGFSLIRKGSGEELWALNLQARSEYPVFERLSSVERAKDAAESRAFKELAEELVEVMLSGL